MGKRSSNREGEFIVALEDERKLLFNFNFIFILVSEPQVKGSKLTRLALGGRLLDIGFNSPHEFRDMD